MQNILLIESSEKVNLTDVYLEPQEQNTDNSNAMILQLSERETTNTTKYFYETRAFDPPKYTFKILVRKKKLL